MYKVDINMVVGTPVLITKDSSLGGCIGFFSQYRDLQTIDQRTFDYNPGYYTNQGIKPGDSAARYVTLRGIYKVLDTDTQSVANKKVVITTRYFDLESVIFLTKQNFSLVLDNLLTAFKDLKDPVLEFDKLLQAKNQQIDSII